MASATRLAVTVTTASSLVHGAVLGHVEERVQRELEDLFDELHVDARPAVEVTMDSNATQDPIALFVRGRRCRFPRELVCEAAAYADGVAIVPATVALALEPTRCEGKTDGTCRLGELLASVCRGAISAQPELLQGDEAARKSAGAGEHRVPAFVPLATSIDIEVEPAYLASLVSSPPASDLFPFARETLHSELGVRLPTIHFARDPTLKPGGFRFRFGGVASMPRIGLSAGTILVNVTADNPNLGGTDAITSLFPQPWMPGAIVSATHRTGLEPRGITAWDAWGFLTLSLATAVRAEAHRFLTHDDVATMVHELEAVYPALVRVASERLRDDSTVDLLRALLYDNVSIRNMRRIAELILRHETTDGAERQLDPLCFVRAGMADMIAQRLSRETGTVVAYLLDSAVERALLGSEVDDGLAERVNVAVRNEVESLPAQARKPAIIVRPETRALLRRLLRPEFPYIDVISYGEVPPDWNVQPVARISWPENLELKPAG